MDMFLYDKLIALSEIAEQVIENSFIAEELEMKLLVIYKMLSEPHRGYFDIITELAGHSDVSICEIKDMFINYKSAKVEIPETDFESWLSSQLVAPKDEVRV